MTTQAVKEAVTNNDFKTALRGVKDWKLGMNKSDRDQLRLGYECIIRPDFYKQIGKNPEAEINTALIILKQKLQGE